MLVVVSVHLGVDACAPWAGILIRVESISIEDAGKLNLRLDGAVLVEDPLNSIFVVGGSEDLLDDELACAGNSDRLVSEVRVLEENAGVLLVDADGVLDGLDVSITGWELSVEIVDGTLAIAAQGERVGHVT
jgi:hypothetical protein